jgi:aryl-alcohol dehydrogenase-like predicted oxidoreductase
MIKELNTKRRLGRTDFQTTVIGLGGHTYPVGNAPDSFCNYEERARLVQFLVDSGVNYFDTTWINEVELLADSFKRININDEVFVSLQYVDGISDANWRQKLRKELETRLKIMNYDNTPLFLMGVGNANVSYSEIASACEAMARLKEEKLIQNMGISCHQIGLFPLISKAIRETDLIDYMMIRFNWKYQQANDELFPMAIEHDVGIVIMKVFCWDCGPGQWDRRISVFEPIRDKDRIDNVSSMIPSQKSLIWSLMNSPASVAVPAMNIMWEAKQNIQALNLIDAEFDIDDFAIFKDRLWDEKEIRNISQYAESEAIRQRARSLLKA